VVVKQALIPRAAARLRYLSRAAPLMAATFLLIAGAPAAPVLADELATLSAQILNSPTDVSLNLRYAALAEQDGLPRLALAAYERVIAVDPSNPTAKAGLNRVRVALEPNLTQIDAELEAVYETNPLAASRGANGEFQTRFDVTVKDERRLGQVRWRSLLQGDALYHTEQSSLNYGYLGFLTGPLINLTPNVRLHTAVGASVAGLGKQLYYWQALGALTLEFGAASATQSIQLRAGYRQYDPSFISDQGFFADATGQFTLPDLSSGTALLLSPWVRYSNVGGSITTGVGGGLPNIVTPGTYVDVGGKAEIQQKINGWLTVAGNVTFSGKQYLIDLVPATTTKRLDLRTEPGASIILPRLIGGKADVRFDYTYLLNDSNDNAHDFADQRFSLSLSGRF
jgi:hypothetical protein